MKPVSFLPILCLSATPILLMMAIAIKRNHPFALAITGAGLLAGVSTLPMALANSPVSLGSLFVSDRLGLFYVGFILLATLAVSLLGYTYLERKVEQKEEFYILLCLASLGSSLMVISSHFVPFILGLELLSVALYALIAYFRTNSEALEAGIKYLVLAAASSAFLLFGVAIIYLQFGTMDFAELSTAVIRQHGLSSPAFLAASGLLIVGIGFKLALVPFHMWTADIYEGASPPVTAFVATVSKGGVVGFLVRYVAEVPFVDYYSVWSLLCIMCVLSMFVGNFLALRQDNVKRTLAYSSIAHFGYLFVALLAGGWLAIETVTFYLVAYAMSLLIAFGVITVLGADKENDPEMLPEYAGLFWTRPLLATILTASLLSLAGIPLTAGFIGKYMIVATGVKGANWILVGALIVNSAVSLYYYLRIVVTMLSEPAGLALKARVSLAATTIILILFIGLIWIGVQPSFLLDWIDSARASLIR